MRRTWIAAAALALAFASGCAVATPVSIALDWTPNTNHTGIFVAEALGYFAQEGLEVTVLEPSPVVSLQLVASGRADFGVSSQEYVVMARAEETPVVSVATLYPHNTSGFAALASTGIASPADFVGRRYGGWGSDLEAVMIETVMENAGADPSRVEVINMGTLDFATAAQVGLADFFWIYYGWEGIHAQLLGLEFNYLPLALLDPVLDYYTPVLVASEATLEERPDLARRFLRALARGYVYCATSPEAAAEILLARAPELDRGLAFASQNWLAAETERSLGAWGRQDAEVWRRFGAWALDHALIRRAVDPDAAFTNAFLPEDVSP
jgi:ABC-type nitrate/sulfonate/bicarbonate transport system substrate-binding protein